ncbi:MAG: hypothetical protein ACRC33_07970 [Gemmataceae bacterium]
MRWRKLGPVFNADGRHGWMASHAANPVAEPVGGDVFRVYFSPRDADGRAHVASVDVELGDAPRVVAVADVPAVAPGTAGAFDDSGTTMGCLVHDGPRTYLFYLGWNLGVTVPWRNSIGLAVRDRPDAPFVKHSPAPALDRCRHDPFTLSYPCVIRDGAGWRMWYGSNLAWGRHQSDMHHVIKSATSDDLVTWHRDGAVAVGLEGDEVAVCRPWVVKEDGRYEMWFCHRTDAYRMGYAESDDGVTWRRGAAGLEPSADGWDSEMVAYGSVCDHRGRRYLFYNGNRYGKTGFGVAVAEG